MLDLALAGVYTIRRGNGDRLQYVPQVISETFTLSLLTAVLLKGVLEIVVAAKNRVKARFREASTPAGKVVAAVLPWVVLFGSKFLVLEVVALVFGDRVSLGGFFSVTGPASHRLRFLNCR